MARRYCGFIKDSIQKDDKTIFLSKTEMIILEMLINKRNQIVTRDTLITALWDDEAFVSDNTLTVNVNRLRKNYQKLTWIVQLKPMLVKDT